MKKFLLLLALLTFGAFTTLHADSSSLVSSVTPGSDGTTSIVVSGDDAPFVADANTIVVIDGQNAQVGDIKVGLQVVSRTSPGSSRTEIDLKTAPVEAPTKKHFKKKTTSDDNQ